MTNKKQELRRQIKNTFFPYVTAIKLFMVVMTMFSGISNAIEVPLEKVLKHKVIKERQSVGVSVAFIENGVVTYLNIGTKDKKSKEKVTENTLFEIGSVTKTFTALALATFVIEDKLSLSDPVQSFLQQQVKLPSKNSKAITFESLANHHSGLPRLPGNMPFSDPQNPYADYTTDMLFDYLEKHKLSREVGEAPEYSNLGVGLLGQALAMVNHSDYEKMLRQQVLKPLKMSQTYITVPKSEAVKRSKGHDAALVETSFWQIPALEGAGALVSNASDMAKYLLENMEKELLPKAIELTHRQTAKLGSSNVTVGLAWLIQGTPKGNVIMHNGQTGGFASFIGFNTELNKGIVILSNASVPLDEIGQAYLTDSLSSVALNTPVHIDVAKLQKLVGEFQLVPGFSLTITNEEGRLFVQGTGQPKLPLVSRSETEFENQSVQARIIFDLNDNGDATQLTLYQGGQVLKGKKFK